MAADGVPLSQQVVAATTDNPDWDLIDAELRAILTPTTLQLASDDISLAEAGDIFSTLLRNHLEHYNIPKLSSKKQTSNSQPIRRTRRIAKVTENLRQMKEQIKKSVEIQPCSISQLSKSTQQSKES